MRKLSIAFFLLFVVTAGSAGQNDPKAVSLLDRFSAKASAAPSVSMHFLLITVDQLQNSIDTVAGSVVLSRNSYRLDLPDNIIWYNGVTSWSYLPAEEEVTITEPDKDDNSFQNRPSLIFTMYKEGYKCRLLEEKPAEYVIDLYPADLKDELIRVRLTIARPSLYLKSFEYKKRNGVTHTLVVSDYSLSRVPEAGFFEFNSGRYKGVEIIDMR